MTTSYTYTETFNVTHATRIASKVAADLKRLQRFYRCPTDEWIDWYEREIITLLKHDVLKDVVYGFYRYGKWTEASLKYVAAAGGVLSSDDDPGKIRAGLDITHAVFHSYLTHNSRWAQLSVGEKEAIRRELPFQRVGGVEPPLENGYWSNDLNYHAGGRGLGRSSVRR